MCSVCISEGHTGHCMYESAQGTVEPAYNSVQQIKAEITALLRDYDSAIDDARFPDMDKLLSGLRRLSTI